MKAQELNGIHLGQRFVLSVAGATVDDTLIGIEHVVDMISDGTVGSAGTNVVPGRRHTALTFLNVGKVGTDYAQSVRVEPVAPMIGAGEVGPHGT